MITIAIMLKRTVTMRTIIINDNYNINNNIN